MSIATILITILIFGIMITTHEFGHFIVARKCGVKVEEFAIGMGPAIFQVRSDKSDTLYSLRIFPIGGYCKMYGEDGPEQGEGSFNSIAPIKKIAVLAAGAMMNLITAFVALLLLYSIVGTTPVNTIGVVYDNTPAYEAKLEKGDEIIAINDKKMNSWEDTQKAIAASNGKELKLTVKSEENGKERIVKVTPKREDSSDTYKIGISPQYTKTAGSVISTTVSSFFNIIYLIFKTIIDLFRGMIGIDQLSGPIGIASVINSALSQGFPMMLNITALLSINIGIFNLLPIPALDGSRIFFTIIEMIKGSPVDPEKEGLIHAIGFALLMALAVFIAFQDITKFF